VKSSRSGSSFMQLPFHPPPSTPGFLAGSAQQFDQPSGSSLTQDDDLADDRVAISHDLPAVAELLREQRTVTSATAELAMAKATYLQTEVQSRRLKMFERIANLDTNKRDKQLQACLSVLQNGTPYADVEKKSREFFTAFVDDRLPALNVAEIFKQLGNGLPGITEIADIFRNAPALAPGNPFDRAQPPDGTYIRDDATALSSPCAPAPASPSANASAGFVATAPNRRLGDPSPF
jgi:hypothetical protein